MVHPTRSRFQDEYKIARSRENTFLEPAPDSLFVKIIIGILYLLALASLVFFIWAGQQVAVWMDAFSQVLHARPANLVSIRAVGLMIGLPPALLTSSILAGLGQMLSLLIRVEKNTRLGKELAYYLFTEGKAQPPI